MTRLHHPEKVAQPQVPTEPSPEKLKTPRKRRERENPRAWRCDDISGLLELLMNTRESIHTHARRLRVAFNLFNVMQTYLVQHNLGYKNTSGLSTMSRAGADSRMSIFEMMSACLKGTLVAKEGKYMGMVIRCVSTCDDCYLITDLTSSGEIENLLRNNCSNFFHVCMNTCISYRPTFGGSTNLCYFS